MNLSYLIIGAAILLCLFFVLFLGFKKKNKAASSLVTEKSLKPKLFHSFSSIFNTDITQEILSKVEEKLIQADIDLDSCSQILSEIKSRSKIDSDALKEILADILHQDYDKEQSKFNFANSPTTLMFVGVNGVGKTSTIGKLAWNLRQQGKSVCLVPADTFRAGAIDQLKIWSETANCHFIDAKMNEDPAAVVYRGVEQAIKLKYDILLIDTAGRLHNNSNLMAQLEKISKIAKKLLPNGIDETIVVLDGCLGQNSLIQLEEFNKICSLSGVAITKLDGSAKGGVVFGIQRKYNIPVKLMGLGEKKENLKFFEVDEYVQNLV